MMSTLVRSFARTHARARAPTHPRTHAQLLNTLAVALGNGPEALVHLTESIASGDPVAAYNRAELHRESGNLTKAVDDYEQCITLTAVAAKPAESGGLAEGWYVQ